MGLLYCPRFVALGATGAILPGAKLYTFDSVSITTPKATYSDNGLTVSNGPYVQADSSGVFPPIFGAANEQYYMLLKTSGDVTVDEFPFATILGADATTTFLKDLGANGRFQVSGTGGVVQIETANAEGDDVGGSGRLGGYAGTQGDALEVDYADTSVTGNVAITGNLSAGGTLTLGGLARPVPRLLTRSSTSAANATDIALDQTYEAWEIRVAFLTQSVAAAWLPGARLSFDNGATYKSGASDYKSSGYHVLSAGAAVDVWATATYAKIFAPMAQNNVTGGYGAIKITVTSKAGQETHVDAEYSNYDSGNVGMQVLGWWTGTTNITGYGKATHLRILDTASGSNLLTFDYTVIGLP